MNMSSREKSRDLVFAAQLLLTAIIVLILFKAIDTEVLFELFANSKLEFIFLAICAYLVVNFLNAYKLHRLLILAKSSEKMEGRTPTLSFLDTFSIHMSGMLVSDVTPGRSGYLSTIFLFRSRKRISGALSTAAVALFQLSEILIKLVGSIVGFLFFFNLMTGSELPVYFFMFLLILVLLFSFVAVVLFSTRALKFVNLFNGLLLVPRHVKLAENFESMQSNARSMKSELPTTVILTVLAWGFKGVEWFSIALALGIAEIDLTIAFVLHPLISSFALIPVSLAGLGVMETAAVIIFGSLHVTAEKVIAFILLGRIIDLFTDLIGIKELAV